MKNIFLLIAIVTGVFILACNKTSPLASTTASTIFSVTTKMTHSKDSLRNSSDTVVYSAQGSINDTSRKYTISASVLAVDTTTLANVICGTYYKTINATLKFDTVGMAKSGLFHWTTSLSLYYPPVASKTGIKTTATFSYGLGLSSQTGTQVATDTKVIHVK